MVGRYGEVGRFEDLLSTVRYISFLELFTCRSPQPSVAGKSGRAPVPLVIIVSSPAQTTNLTQPNPLQTPRPRILMGTG